MVVVCLVNHLERRLQSERTFAKAAGIVVVGDGIAGFVIWTKTKPASIMAEMNGFRCKNSTGLVAATEESLVLVSR